LDPAQPEEFQRGDLIFWKGMCDRAGCRHHRAANAHHMATVIENTRDAIARIRSRAAKITAISRRRERLLVSHSAARRGL